MMARIAPTPTPRPTPSPIFAPDDSPDLEWLGIAVAEGDEEGLAVGVDVDLTGVVDNIVELE